MTSRTMTTQWMVNAGKAGGESSAMVMQQDMDPEELSAWLRSLSLAEIFGIFDAGFAGMIQMPLLIGDGYVLPELSAVEIFSDPDLHVDVPVILGSNRDEMALFMAFQPEYVAQLGGFPTTINNPDAYRRDVNYGSRYWRAGGVDEIAQALSESQSEPVYAYRFDADDWRNLGFVDFRELFGAAHGLDVFFVFGYFPNPMKILFPDATFKDIALLSDSMRSYWAEFARTGKPGVGSSGEQPHWSPWMADSPGHFLVLDTEMDGGIRMDKEVLTTEGVRAAFLAEDFGSIEEKCLGYRSVFFGAGFVQAEYESLGCQ